jgi:hypothetical protein
LTYLRIYLLFTFACVNGIIIISIIIIIIIIIIIALVFCFYVCIFLFSTRARFVIGLWAVKFAHK